MKRLYIAPMSVLHEHAMRGVFPADMTTHFLCLYDPAKEGDIDRWQAAGSPVVIITDITRAACQDVWESHSQVTVLPDPVMDASLPISNATEMAENATVPVGFRGVSAAAGTRMLVPMLAGVSDASTGQLCDGVVQLVEPQNLGVVPTDTVVDVHRKLTAVHPAFKLRGR